MPRVRSLVLVSLALALGLVLSSGAPGGIVSLSTAARESRPSVWQAKAAEAMEEEGEAGGPAAPGEWGVAQRLGDGDVAVDAFARAAAAAEALGAATAQEEPELAETEWQFNGPTNIGGRVVDVVVDPTLANTIYIGAASGGVWKSADAGATFQQAWPVTQTQAIGALAGGSDGTLYAGTGEANPGGGSLTFGGTGVYRSKDRGASWQSIGLEESGAIGRIVVDPSDPKKVYVGAAGPLYREGGERGLYRSTDGGDSFQRILAPANETTGVADIAIDPRRPQRIFVSMWDHLRQPDLRTYGGTGSGLYRSTDGGATWERLGGGLPAVSANVGRIGVAVSPVDSDRVYAIVIAANGYFEGFYASVDGGTTWTKMPADPTLSGSQSSFGWWFGRIWVDPVDPLHVYVAGVSLMESLAGGLGWASAVGPHADQHAMAWDPKLPGRVYLGNDGGVYRSDNFGIGANWTFATSQPFTQFYSLDVSEQDPTRVVGGAQDNGVNRSYGGASAGAWDNYGGGDGLAALINPQDQQRVYGCSQYGSCSRSTNGGDSSSGFGATTSTRRNWYTPVVFDPNDPAIMYYGGNRLNRSTNHAASWTAISPDLTGGPGRDTQYPFGTITAVAPAKSDGEVLYVGTDDGRLWRTGDLGATWERLEDPALPTRWVTRIVVDPRDDRVAFVAFSGFRNGEDDATVVRTDDGGDSWTDISQKLPPGPVNDLTLVGDDLYVASDVGVFLTRDLGDEWFRVGTGLPLAPVFDIRYHAVTNTLHAGTFGRGMWKAVLPA